MSEVGLKIEEDNIINNKIECRDAMINKILKRTKKRVLISSTELTKN